MKHTITEKLCLLKTQDICKIIKRMLIIQAPIKSLLLLVETMATKSSKAKTAISGLKNKQE